MIELTDLAGVTGVPGSSLRCHHLADKVALSFGVGGSDLSGYGACKRTASGTDMHAHILLQSDSWNRNDLVWHGLLLAGAHFCLRRMS